MTDTIENIDLQPGDSVTLSEFGGYSHVVIVHIDDVRVLVARDYDDPGRCLTRGDFNLLRATVPSTPPSTFWIELTEYRPGLWAVNRHSLRPGEDYTPQSRRDGCRWARVALIETID